MHISYPTLTQDQINRQGQLWWECDGADCTEQAHVEDGKIPEGWVTADPNDDAQNGSATFCPKHLGLAPLPADLETVEYYRADQWREDNGYVNAFEVDEPEVGTQDPEPPSAKVPQDVFRREVLKISDDEWSEMHGGNPPTEE